VFSATIWVSVPATQVEQAGQVIQAPGFGCDDIACDLEGLFQECKRVLDG